MKNHSSYIKAFSRTKPISNLTLIDEVKNFSIPSSWNALAGPSNNDIPDNLMLGKRAERYFSEIIERSTEYELVVENVQIIEGRETLGEFDFFLKRLADNQMIHLELVYKFYVYDPSASEIEFERWIGPNQRDRLDYKIEKLSEHQFPLLYSGAAKSTLLDLNIDSEACEQHVLFLAQLFIPKAARVNFDQINEACVEGTWLRMEDWKSEHVAGDAYAIPSKNEWFLRDLEQEVWRDMKETIGIIENLHENSRSPLVWKKNASGNQSRSFVVWW